jgi:oxalate decarboxylase/phosphoglucose isomerase-like protein (cupin superfamily)
VYFFLSGSGEVVLNGESTAVTAGDAVFIPGNMEHMSVNTGTEPLRLLYFFPADSFADIEYKFPGQS